MMQLPALTGVILATFVVTYSQACLLRPGWEPWNLTRRTQHAETIIVGVVTDYYPVFPDYSGDGGTPIYYTAQFDVSCVFGADPIEVATGIHGNNGHVNVTGLDVQYSCGSTTVTIGSEYIFMLVGGWNGGLMRPDQINAQPSAFNTTPEALTEFSDAMSDYYIGYAMRSETCPAAAVDFAESMMTTASESEIATTTMMPKLISKGTKGDVTSKPPATQSSSDGDRGTGTRHIMRWTLILFICFIVLLI